ncbi:MAG: efflux RND transporter periplasmic adaptor subunit [Planctomycetaceae bacterium]
MTRAELAGQQLAVTAADLEVRQAHEEHEVLQLQAQLKRHDLELSRLTLQRRRMLSPLDGVVVEVYQNRGEWVEPGQPVLRVQRQNRLWAEGLITVDRLADCTLNCPVRLTVPTGPEESVEVTGRIVFIGREVDPVNRELLVRAEIPNDDLRLLPGMDGMLVIGQPSEDAAQVDPATPR